MSNPAQELLNVLQNEVEFVEVEEGKVVAGDPVEVDVLTDKQLKQVMGILRAANGATKLVGAGNVGSNWED